MAEEKRNDFINESVKDELIAKAEHWLNKGVALEDEGKSATMVNKCLEKAVNFEDQAMLVTT